MTTSLQSTTLHCFNMKYDEITKNLENYASLGITHILISPACLTVPTTSWWGRYQPLHYFIIAGPLGNRDQLNELCDTAKKFNISIVADMVLNHMATPDNNKNASNVETLNFCEKTTLRNHPEWEEIEKQYNNLPVKLKKRFPLYSIFTTNYLFTKSDFNNNGNINDYKKREEVINNNLGNLPDLNQNSINVFKMQKLYIKFMVTIGITSMRFDAVKHMPETYCASLIKCFEDALIEKYKTLPYNSLVMCELIPDMKFAEETQIYIDAFNAKSTTNRTTVDYSLKKKLNIKVIFYDFQLMNKYASYVLPMQNYKENESKPLYKYNENIREIIDQPKDNSFTVSQSMSFITNHDIIYNDCFHHWMISNISDKRIAYTIMMFLTRKENLYLFTDNSKSSPYYDEINLNKDLQKLLLLRKKFPDTNYDKLYIHDNIFYIGYINNNTFFIINNQLNNRYEINENWPKEPYLSDLIKGEYVDIFDGIKINIEEKDGKKRIQNKLNIPPNATYLFRRQIDI